MMNNSRTYVGGRLAGFVYVCAHLRGVKNDKYC